MDNRRLINDFNYPILKVCGLDNYREHPMFKNYYHRLDDKEIKEALERNEEFRDQYNGHLEKYGFAPEVYVNAVAMTPSNRSQWPLFAMNTDDFRDLGYDKVYALDQVLESFWNIIFKDAVPEIITRDAWDRMYYDESFEEDVFEEWTKSKSFRGIMLRPGEEIAQLYYIDNTDREIPAFFSLCLHKRETIHFGFNRIGFVSHTIEFPDTLNLIARNRRCTPVEAYFQEDAYNILRYLYWREKNGLKPVGLEKGMTVGDSGLKYYSDAKCVHYE